MSEIVIDLYKKLDELRKTKYDKETYKITEMSSFLRYGERFGGDDEVIVPFKCYKCKKIINYKTTENDAEKVDIYKKIVNGFCLFGMDAKFVCHCDDCCENGWYAKPFEIWLSSDSVIYNRTYPIEFSSCDDERYNVRIQEYLIALKFLRACINVDIDTSKTFDFLKDKINLSYSTLYSGTTFERDVANYGFIKPIVDLALNKVLDLNITYDREELKENIKFLLNEYNKKEHDSYGDLFEDSYAEATISESKYEKLISIVEDIIDNKNLDEILVLDYDNFLQSLQFIFEYDDKHTNTYNSNYISMKDLENRDD